MPVDQERKKFVDFGDAYLAATAIETREAVATFDKDFKKFPDLSLHALG